MTITIDAGAMGSAFLGAAIGALFVGVYVAIGIFTVNYDSFNNKMVALLPFVLIVCILGGAILGYFQVIHINFK